MKLNNLSKKKVFIIVALIVIVAGGAAIGSKNKKVEVKQEVKNVRVQKIDIAAISTDVEYASTLNPVSEITVIPKISGKVATVNVNVGDKVEAGQVLFTLDSSELNAQLAQQQAGFNVASANLAKTSDSVQLQQVSSAEQTLGKAQISYNDAKSNYDKMQQLYVAGAIAKVDLDSAKSKYDSSALDLKAAQDNLDLVKEKSGPESIQAAEAQVEQAQAGVNYAKAQLNNMTVTTPIAGIVAAKSVEVGELASAPSNSVIIIDSSTLIAEISVPDKMIENFQVGESVPVNVTALQNKEITGTIDNISPYADPKTKTYTVKVKIDNSNGDIKAGMFAKVAMPAEKKDNVIAVPNEAIKIENGVNYIYTVDGDKVKKVAVETGISDDKFTEIVGNIKEGTNLITEGQNLLNDGEKVNIIK